MATIQIKDLNPLVEVSPDMGAQVKGGPLEIRELNVKAVVAKDVQG